jgi:GNAT superfamily N-acetyltransferase
MAIPTLGCYTATSKTKCVIKKHITIVLCKKMEWKRDSFTVTTELAKFDMAFVTTSLQSTWRKGATREMIEDAFAKSLSFGLFDGEKQVGCVRAVTDRRFVSWVCDLYLDPEYRGKKLGRWFMDCVMNHPDLVHTRLVFSSVPESQAFFERIGFKPMERGYSIPPRGTEQGTEGDAVNHAP